MKTLMRAKVRVLDVQKIGNVEAIRMEAVDANSVENKVFARSTPNLKLSIQIDNSTLHGKIVQDTEFYLDFIPVDSEKEGDEEKKGFPVGVK